MSRYYCCSACDANAKGKDTPPGNNLDWPEVAKHRKKGGKPRKREKSDHKHIYTWVDNDVWYGMKSPYYTLYNGRRFIYESEVCCEWTCQKKRRMRIKYLD